MLHVARENVFVTFCITALLLLCFYQTWLRKKENVLIADLSRNISINQDKKYLLDRLTFSAEVIDSLHKLKNEKLFVLRFMRNDCKECIDSIFGNLISISSKIGKENIAVLIDDPNLNNYYKYKRLYQDKIINFFYYPTGVSAIDKEGISYYSIYSKKNKTASFIFLTNPLDFPSQTNNYLKGIVNVF